MIRHMLAGALPLISASSAEASTAGVIPQPHFGLEVELDLWATTTVVSLQSRGDFHVGA